MAHPGGRPLKFQTVDEIKKIADKYFAETPKDLWTITGLALALDTTRDVLIDYQEKDEFSYTIKKYKQMVHNAYEEDLRKKGRSGDIFALKNFGWRDRQETTLTDTEGNSIQPVYVQFLDGEKKDNNPNSK